MPEREAALTLGSGFGVVLHVTTCTRDTAVLAATILLGGFCSLAHATASDNGGVETVIVTAEKRAEDIQQAPMSVAAFTSKSIANLGIKESSDVGEFLPNVEISLPFGAGGQPEIVIRGVGLNDFDTNNAGPNGVYLDEVYLSAPAAQTFQAFDLERIEVLKGPQGTLYGRNTSGGAINYVTVKPGDGFSANIHADWGSFDTFQVEGAAGGQIADDLDGRLAFVKNGSGGFTRNLFDGLRENGTNNEAARLALQWDIGENLTLLANVHGGYLDNRPVKYRQLGLIDPVTMAECGVARAYTPGSGCVDIFGYASPRSFFAGGYNRQVHEKIGNLGGSLRVDYRLNDIEFVSLSAFERNDKFLPEETDSSPNRLLEVDFRVGSSTFTEEFRATESTDRYNWVLGFYLLAESLRQNQPFGALLDFDKFFGPGSGDGVASVNYDRSRQVTDSYAIFGQGTYDLTPSLKLTLGARGTLEHKSFDYAAAVQFQEGGMYHFGPITPILPPPGKSFDRSLSNEGFNWRAALSWDFVQNAMAYASVSTGFKSGGFNGGFLSTDPVQIDKQLDPIKPEEVTAYEAGVKSNLLDDRVQIDAAIFYNDYRDHQTFLLEPIPGSLLEAFLLANAARSHMEGAEVEIEARPNVHLTLSASLGLLQAKFDSSEDVGFDALGNPLSLHAHQLPLAPHVTATLTADYTIDLTSGVLDLLATASYRSHQFFDVANNPYLHQNPYWLEDLRVGYTLPENQWEVAAFVHNLLDEKYFVFVGDLSALGFDAGTFGRPREWGFEVNYRI